MTTKSTPANDNDKVICKYCSKPVSRTGSIKNQHGTRCAFIQATLGDNVAQNAHLKKYTDNAIGDNKNYCTLASVSASIKANGLTTVSRFVKAFGTDKNALTPAHVSLTPIYNGKRVRFVHRVWLTKTAQTILATNQYSKINANVTKQAQAALKNASAN